MFYGPQSGCSVVEVAGKYDADDALSVRKCRRTKQRVDSGPETIFTRPFCRADRIALYQQMPVGRRNVNAAGPDLFFVESVCRVKRPTAVENLGQKAANVGRHMPDNKNRCVQVARKV